MANSKKILIVDDEDDILEFLEYNLKNQGYEVATALDGKEAIKTALKFLPDLILLDIMMPIMDGIETCTELRKLDKFKNTVIAFLTARNEDYSQIAGFDAGGDDYITKPIKPKVLNKRIEALLKRTTPQLAIADVSKFGELSIDREQFLIFKGDESVVLTKKEFELFDLLSSKPNKVFKRLEIYNKVWGSDLIVGDRTIDVHIRKLREKLGDDYIKTVKGVGYKFVF